MHVKHHWPSPPPGRYKSNQMLLYNLSNPQVSAMSLRSATKKLSKKLDIR